MDALTPPPPLRVEDLDRAELLELVKVGGLFVTQRDLWRARWEVASRRADEAFKAESVAFDSYMDALKIHAVAPPSKRRKAFSAVQACHAEVSRRTLARKRASVAENRASRALQAIYQ